MWKLISGGHTNCLVRLEIVWVQDPQYWTLFCNSTGVLDMSWLFCIQYFPWEVKLVWPPNEAI